METIRRNRTAFKQQRGRPVGVGVCLRLAHPSFLLVSGQQSPCFLARQVNKLARIVKPSRSYQIHNLQSPTTADGWSLEDEVLC